MKNICVFCSASDVDGKYRIETEKLGTLIGKNGYALVWGGSETGLMKVLADSVQASGGKLIGVSMIFFQDVARKNADEMIITKTLAERKSTMLDRSDAIVLLVGGTGSLDEITEILEMKKLRKHDKPIVILNTNGFYNGLKMQLEQMVQERFLKMELNDLIIFTQTPEEVIPFLQSNGV